MKRTYADKRITNGRDSYGRWRDGVQLNPDVICGRTLVYNHKTGQWR